MDFHTMRIPSKPPDMKANQAYAYIAGIIDGEGSLTLQHSQDKKGYSHGVVARLQICNTSYDLILFLKKWLEKMAKGPITIVCVERTRTSNKKIWRIMVNSKMKLRRILLRVMPFLIIKRKQADIIMHFVNRGLYVKVKDYGSKCLYADIEYMMTEMHRLNRRKKKSGDCVTTNTQDVARATMIESEPQ